MTSMILPPTLVATMAIAICPPTTPAAQATTTLTPFSDLTSKLERLDADLGKAKADASKLAAAVRVADKRLAGAEDDLAAAQRRFADARRRNALASESLSTATAEVWRQEARRNQQAPHAFVAGGPMTQIGYVLSAGSVAEAGRRFTRLGRVAKEGDDTVTRLRDARRQVASSHASMVASERQASAQRIAVAARVASLDRARAARVTAKRGLDARIAELSRGKARLEHQVIRLLKRARQEDAAVHTHMLMQLRRNAKLARLAEAAGKARRASQVVRRGGHCDLGSLSGDERWIVMRESSGNPTAGNGRSSHFGLGQLSLANRMRYLGEDHSTTDCGKQVRAFRAYVASAYGSAAAARSFWRANGWY
jgi:septal ring factor EnvC (AmiA/AmiB activator)